MDDHHPVPGTVHLVDLEGIVNAKHASGSQRDVVLIPFPSSDPDDPLNWSARRKSLSDACICLCVLLTCFSLSLSMIDNPKKVYVGYWYRLSRHLFGPRTHSKGYWFEPW